MEKLNFRRAACLIYLFGYLTETLHINKHCFKCVNVSQKVVFSSVVPAQMLKSS